MNNLVISDLLIREATLGLLIAKAKIVPFNSVLFFPL